MRLLMFLIPMVFFVGEAHASNVAVCLADGTFVRYARSVHTPDFINGLNLINPNMLAVQGVPHRHRKCLNGQVVRMNRVERDSVDAAISAKEAVGRAKLQALRDALIAGDPLTPEQADRLMERLR